MSDAFLDTQLIVTDLSQRAIDHILNAAGQAVKEYWAKFRSRDVKTYAEYLLRKGVEANSVRNFIYDTKSASLYDIYVPTLIADGNARGNQLLTSLLTPSNDPKRRPARAFALVGPAGTGKSLFMKHAFFFIRSRQENRIPILIEVRRFNRLKLGNIETRIYEDFLATGTTVTNEQIQNALNAGLFVILLDGMDELKKNIQEYYENELLVFSKKYPHCGILTSSRPAQQIFSWADFEVRKIAPLERPAAIDLIEKLDYEPKVKARFISLLEDRLFETHYDFVSVPLLCIIMLLTFTDTGYISKNRHEFFDDAYNALWSKHDGRKEGFERIRRTGLNKKQFSNFLSAFALSSYASSDYEMRETQFTKHFDSACQLSGISCEESDFLQDFVVSTSLGVHDGGYIRFSHRSIQEYFAALFICEMNDQDAEAIIEEISERIETDTVLQLVLSLKEDKIEKNWVLPRTRLIAKFIDECGADVVKYAHEVFFSKSPSWRESQGALGKNGLPKVMSKIRFLYGFEPSWMILKPAYDTALTMSRNIDAIFRNQRPQLNLIDRDRENFIKLSDALTKKYNQKSSALHNFIQSQKNSSSAKP